MKHMNKEEKDSVKINIISNDAWIKRYKELWYDENILTTTESSSNKIVKSIDPIPMEKLEYALKNTKNRKASGMDGINAELVKYGNILLTLRILHLINLC